MTPSPIVPPPGRRAAMRRAAVCVSALGIGLVAVLPIVTATAAQAPVGLGTATSFAVLAGEGITNTGTTRITGDVGTHPNPAMTGFGTVTVIGSTHAADAVALRAKNDLTTAYNTAAAATPTTAVATELGGLTFTPGVYGFETLSITGALTLDTLGDPNAVFIFKAASTLITASDSSVIVIGGGTGCNVYWQVGESATLGTDSAFVGTVLAATSITANTRATIQGRLLAGTGAVTMDTNTITRPRCAPPLATTTTTTAPSTTTTTAAQSGSTTTLPGTASTLPTVPAGPGVVVPVGSAATVPAGATGTPGLPGVAGGTGRGGTTPAGATGRSARPGSPGSPGLPATGLDLGVGVAGIGAVLFGTILVAAARLRRRSTAAA